MNANLTSPNWNALSASALGLVTVVLVSAYLAGWKLPWISTDRAAVFMAAALGFAMCMLGMGTIATGLGWTHPITIVGALVGALIIFIVIAVMAGWRLPLLADDRTALVAVVALGLVKWGLGIFSHIVLRV